MIDSVSHILARSSDDGWGGLIIAVVVIIGWIVKAIGSAVNTVKTQNARRIAQPPPVIPAQILRGPPPVKGKKPQATRKQAKAGLAPPLPQTPQAPLAPMTPAVGSGAHFSPSASRPATAKLTALRTRIIWSEIVGKPLALRDDHLY